MQEQPVALITGGTRGIGLGIAQCLAQAGYTIVVTGRRAPAEVEPQLKEQFDASATVHYVPSDIRDLSAHPALLDAVSKAFGRLDVLVNNAGVAPDVRKDILEAAPESYDRVMDINVKGPYFLTQRVANWMVEQKQAAPERTPSIVFITSISSDTASPSRGDYCLSKAALSMAAKLFAVRLAEHNIPTWEVRPGIIASDMTAGVKSKYDHLIADGLLLERRWGQPQDIGKAVRALVTGEVPYSTGSALHIDGGFAISRL
ncbi:MAG: 3-ketoacyl-ACP reductase [Bacteroidetes bacterium]|jgi:NAD(P)-dependent dehydrogenase (short-subunit alcohol dehydrogenase family)|nr:3-ketoacyl-ACP reductase [Bacteroidota bacterium]